MNAVALRINEKALVKNLRYAFTSKSVTVLCELMQNARRAGATKVGFTLKGDVLRVEDDGVGIHDFGDLLAVAQSGWDIETIEKERPYGLGFLAAVYGSTHIRVESLQWKLDADTKDILDFKPIVISKTAKLFHGTKVVLCGFNDQTLLGFGFYEVLSKVAAGFPIEVTANGRKVSRPDALGQGDFRDSRVGKIRIPRHAGAFARLYYQGLPLWAKDIRRPDSVVVHLDTSRFTARLPDRDTLVDDDSARYDIRAAVREAQIQSLKEERKKLGDAGFLKEFYGKIISLYPSMLNGIDYLPGTAFERVDKPQVSYPNDHFMFLRGMEEQGIFSRAELSKMKLVRVEDIAEDDDSDACAAAMYAHLTGALNVSELLPDEHWVNSLVHDLRGSRWDVTPLGNTHTAGWEGNWTRAKVIFCDGYTLRNEVTGESVTTREHALYHSLECPGTVFYPGKTSKASVLMQMSNFCDENDDYQDGQEEEESKCFRRFIRLNTGVDSAKVMRDILIDATSEIAEALRGKTFTVNFGKKGICVKEKK